MHSTFNVLVVEDNPNVLDSLAIFVDHLPGSSTFCANSYLAAANLLNSLSRVDLLLCDVILRDEMDGIDVAELAVKMHPDIAVVLFSAERMSEIEGLADRYSFIRKPFGREEIMAHIDRAFLHLHPNQTIEDSRSDK